jgi:hypothetical protein
MSVIAIYRQPPSHGLRGVMKTALLYVCAMLLFSSTVTGQSWRDNRARLCFDRPEDNGAVNVLQSWIRIQEYEVPLIGGQAACLYLRPESSDLTITSTIPYDPHSRNAEACKSKPLKLELAPDEDRTFSIEPATNRDSYACGWRIHPTGSSHKTTTKGANHP